MATQIKLVSALPGRLRFRIADLRENIDLTTRIEVGLSRVQGVTRVEVRPYTGSILCLYATEETDDAVLLAQARELVGAKQINGPDTRLTSSSASFETGPSGVARAMAELVQSIDRDIMRGTKGQFDLGAATSLAFLFAGALEVAIKEKMPTPPWFNLAWWGVRTFMTTEQDAIQLAGITTTTK